MSLKILHGIDAAPLEPLEGRTVVVVGFGNQGSAHALNLRDSGLDVIVANRPDSATGRRAIAEGFEPLPIDEAVPRGDLVIVAAPDEHQGEVYERHLAPAAKPGCTIGFIHGFAVRYGIVRPRPDVGVILVAPKGPGRTLRERFVEGLGLPCLFAVHQESPRDDAESVGLAWARGIGCARAGIVYSTFADEAETDLFGEQVVLCGGMTALIIAAFETLVEAGYPPELAYLECCHEVKQVADLVYERGLAAMMSAISSTAEFGAHRSGPRVIDAGVRRRFVEILAEVRDGTFAAAMEEDRQRSFAWFDDQRRALARHPIEDAGRTVRGLMPWLDPEGDA